MQCSGIKHLLYSTRIGSLKPGDVILAINEESLKSATLQDAAALLKSAGSVVTLTVSKDCDFG